jgi:hypothetical protein
MGNRQEFFFNIGVTLIDGIKVAMATLLSVFVPQYCPETGTTCTISDNFSQLSTFNEFVIGWNFLSCSCFFILAYVQNKRERYFIHHLDSSKQESFDSLCSHVNEYPKIKNRIYTHNKHLILWSKITITLFFINTLVSSILVFYYFYDGFRTASTLLANVLLVSSKLYYCISIGYKSNGLKLMALSTIKTEPTSYNVIDTVYKKENIIKGFYPIRVKGNAFNKKKKNPILVYIKK